MILGSKITAIKLKDLDTVVLTAEDGSELLIYARILQASQDSQAYPVIRLLDVTP
jgi:hypothetical protein